MNKKSVVSNSCLEAIPVAKCKRLTVNPSVTILISLTDHLVDFVVGQLLADGGHNVTQLGGGDEAVVVAVEDLNSWLDIVVLASQ